MKSRITRWKAMVIVMIGAIIALTDFGQGVWAQIDADGDGISERPGRPSILIINQDGRPDTFSKSIFGPLYDFVDFTTDLSTLDLSAYDAIAMLYSCPYKELSEAENNAVMAFVQSGGGIVLHSGVPGGFAGIRNASGCLVYSDLKSSIPNRVNTAQWVGTNTYQNSCGEFIITADHYITQDLLVGDIIGPLSCSDAGITDTNGTILGIGAGGVVVLHTYTPFDEGGHVVFQAIATCDNLSSMQLLARALEFAADFDDSTTVLDVNDNGISDGCECLEVSGLTARAKSGKVQLVWTHVGVESYNVYRKVEGGEYSLVANTVSTYSTYLDSSVANGTTYYYLVRSVCNGIESEASNEASATPTSTRRR